MVIPRKNDIKEEKVKQLDWSYLDFPIKHF